jgi:mRNA-degrading endonuclease RelE of RelBE toxin-antitoxin system
MKFIESPLFTKLVDDYLSHDEYIALQWELAIHPDSGAIIPESGGLRKLRWKSKGKGKSGGVRVIYYIKNQEDHIWLLTIYAKNEVQNIPGSVLKRIKEEILR